MIKKLATMNTVKTGQFRRQFIRSFSSNSKPQQLRRNILSSGTKWSYCHGESSIKLLGLTMSQIIDLAPDRFGDNLAVVDRFQNIRKTFVQFKKEVDDIAMGFLSLNLNRGDLLAIWSPNRYEWMLAQMAAAKAGLVLVPVNPAYQKMEFQHVLEKMKLKALLIPETFKTQNFYQMVSEIVPEIADTKSGKINSKKHPYFTDIVMMTDQKLPGIVRFKDLYGAGGSNEKKRLEEIQNEIQIDDDFNVQFTSGTTGKPKGANRILRRAHKISCNVPLFHCFGCVVGTYTTMLSGATCVFPSPSFDPEKILKTIEEEKCTSIYGTPTMLVDLINHPNFDKTNLSSVKRGLIAGAMVLPAFFQQVLQKFNAPELMIAYGTTELSPLVSCQRYSEPLETKFNNVGSVYPNTQIKIVDKNNKIVPIGVDGEICARGFQLMKGYWDEPEKTKEVIVNGWYHTGDLGQLTEDGRLRVTGRIKDMIIRGGENIYPKEIEDFLISNDKIADAQIIGVPDNRMGEEICVWVKLKENMEMTEDELKKFCRGKISHFKIPRYVRFVKEFPKTLSGKVQKFIMKEEMEKILISKK
ncbi:hypothetical protein CHUAL_012371 [Chamberlinius hualienensis]